MIAAAWILLLLLLTAVFNGLLEQQRNPNQMVETRMTDGGVLETTLKRNRQGHYVATGKINGTLVEFLMDTGATTISIPTGVANRLDLEVGPSAPVYTANGTIYVRLTRLDEVQLGSVKLRQVSANINPHMGGDSVLLGMSFLRDLEFSQRGDTLTIRQYGPPEE